jgi:hypothetical protein
MTTSTNPNPGPGPPSVKIKVEGSTWDAIVDAESAELVRSLGPWYQANLLVDGEGKPAARNRIKVEGDRVCAWCWLHNLIMAVPDKHIAPNTSEEVYPKNGWWLDCRKSNLRVRKEKASAR